MKVKRPTARTRRLSWLVSFVIPMVLLALMLALRPADAAPAALGPGAPPAASLAVVEIAEQNEEEGEEASEPAGECGEEEAESEEDETEELETETVEPEIEEAEEPEAEGEAENCGKRRGLPPAECLLRSARARLFAYSSHDRVRLVIRYTTFAPATVSVDYRFTGGKGQQRLGAATRHFAESGLFRVTEKLSHRQMAKVLSAKSFTVTMDIAAAPKYCHRFYTRHLTVSPAVHGQRVWYQSDSTFGGRRK